MRKFAQSILPGLLVLGLITGAKPACAAAGSLDPTFGNGGVTVTSVAGTNGIVNSVLLQSDGKILVFVGGETVLRYTITGALDTSFGSKGIAVLSTPIGGSLALQKNGQIVIGGVVTPSTGGAALGVERLNPNVTQDTSFGSGGLATVSLLGRAPLVGTAVLVQPNGDILVGTQLDPIGRRQPVQTALARFSSQGSLDTTFGNQGLSITNASGCTALALLSNNDILVVASRAIAQLTSSGNLESTVTGGPIVAISQSSSAFVPSLFQANGDYLFGTEVFTGEESRGHNAAAQVLRFTATGSPDPAFANITFHYIGTGGSGIEAFVNGLAVQANGAIVAAGSQVKFAQSGVVTVNGLARLTPAGSLDPTFGNGGTVVNNLPASSGVVVQSDGKIVTAGFASDNTILAISRNLGQ